MKRFRFDVIIIGAGPAGATAAATLARSGLSVLVLEAGVYAGAENWSGCVYFAENLAHPEAFGEAAVRSAPYERRLVRRGLFLHNGLDLVGVSYQQHDTFRHCYTVLRPIYDPYWAALAQSYGAMLIPQTTVISLIRRAGRVVGVETERGPAYAEVVFLAEGDASHLVRRERLERVRDPHFMQGVKAVLSLSPDKIENRFGLLPEEGCAYEYVIRNAHLGGRTAHLNLGAFLYTNRDSISFGYVVPLENLKTSFRGDHSRLLEWLRGLPHFKSLLKESTLSAYGAKLIRSGGLKEQPVLVEDGLGVGGAAVGLGIDLPYPNFTGPASASGLLFARAVRTLLEDGRPITAERLRESYLEPLQASVYADNARFLADWPDYLEQSTSFFGRSVDLICGSARFLTGPKGSLWQTARFLRDHLSLGAIREVVLDGYRMLCASGLKSSLMKNLGPALIGGWITNLFGQDQRSDPGFSIIIRIADLPAVSTRRLPWPLAGVVNRIAPGLAQGMGLVYANNDRPLREKFRQAAGAVLSRIHLTDFVTLPLFAGFLLLLAGVSAMIDLFRYYILRRPPEEILKGPVADYRRAQSTARELDGTQPADSFEMKLATNSYRVGKQSHIRVFWPQEITRHGDLGRSPLWWVCPARVYLYEPPLAGRGSVMINYENCIKCETCWHASGDQVRWGRTTDHRLIYRPETGAAHDLLRHPSIPKRGRPPRERLWDIPTGGERDFEGSNHEAELKEIGKLTGTALRGLLAFETAVRSLPEAADATRRAWPEKVGRMALTRLARLASRIGSRKVETALEAVGIRNETYTDWADLLNDVVNDLETQISAGEVFHALAAAQRAREGVLWEMRDALSSFSEDPSPSRDPRFSVGAEEGAGPPGWREKLSRLFPDRQVKEWEEISIPAESREALFSLFLKGGVRTEALIRELSSISPALGLLAAHHMAALDLLRQADRPTRADLLAVDGRRLSLNAVDGGFNLTGRLDLVPLALSRTLLLVHGPRAFVFSADQPGVKIVPTPGIGFRAAALHRLELDLTLPSEAVLMLDKTGAAPTLPGWEAAVAIALGAGGYLARRAKEHALGRVQFGHQMRDTQGRDGIAKLGAVKQMLARIETWILVLSRLSEGPGSTHGIGIKEIWPELAIALSPLAFGPKIGGMGYDAGQIFGGMAYSEDDLLSRAYRDSAAFPYLMPGFGGAGRLMERWGGKSLRVEAGFRDGASHPIAALEEGPLMDLVREWRKIARTWEARYPGSDPDKSGEALALLLASWIIILWVQEAIEEGRSVEGEAASCDVLVGLAREAVDHLEEWPRQASPLPIASLPEHPDRDAVSLPLTYEEICRTTSGGPYHSGRFLREAYESTPRFVPEVQIHDPVLRLRWKDSNEWFLSNFWRKEFDGMHVERYIEKIHGIPKGALYGFKDRGYFSTIIPPEMGGGGWWKAEYYILNAAAGRFGDAGLLLVIMASTSIGTTPVLLGLERELPLAAEELEPLARDPDRMGVIASQMESLIASLQRPEPARLKKQYTELMERIESKIRRTRVVKYLAANFLKSFYAAGVAGQRGDLDGFRRGLIEARELFNHLPKTVAEAIDELPRRKRAHEFFLKRLSHRGISAFALTEPTAGSDTGGVKTTARLSSRALEPLEDGRYRFCRSEEPLGGSENEAETRFLIDADRIAFNRDASQSGMAYTLPGGEIAPLHHDEYNYDADEGLRYYLFGGEKKHFHDIAQVRLRSGRAYYDYYELNGAKMWITNGHIATQFCLYAQSWEGVTGFMVDRHSEGLKIGADERKMGQRGSPTNEIAIDRVRVPRECVIGYEGHGQVNALETLNVGRCGLAVAAVTLMRKLLFEAKEQVPPSPSRDRVLGEAAAILFASDAVTFHLVGLFDRETTDSVRMESAIAKYLCSEDLHEVLDLVERAYGPEGITERYRVEKIRRDSRILNIYEGTNEVQRFLILKDLVAAVPDWPPIPTIRDSGSVSRLAAWKEKLRTTVMTAASRWGDTIWMDAVLQPTFFPMAEMAGEIFRMDSLIYRLEWLGENRDRLGPDYVDPLREVGGRALFRCEHRLTALERKIRERMAELSEGLYAPETVVADAALARFEKPPQEAFLPSVGLSRPIRVLCLLRRVAEVGPSPRLMDGKLAEIVWRINPTDEAALALAIHLKQRSRASVRIDLLMAGGEEEESTLRWALGSGADSAYRIPIAEAAGGEMISKGISEMERSGRYDLILAGAEAEDGSEPLGPLVAGALSRSYIRTDRLGVSADGQDLTARNDSAESPEERLTREPMILAWDRIDPSLTVGLDRWIEASMARIETIPVPSSSTPACPTASVHYVKTRASKIEIKKVSNIEDVSDFIKAYISTLRQTKAEPFSSEPAAVHFPADPAIWAVLEIQKPKAGPSILGAAGLLARLFGMKSYALLLGPKEEWRTALGTIKSSGLDGGVCIPSPRGVMTERGKIQWLRKLRSALDPAHLLGGLDWSDPMAYLAGSGNGLRPLLITGLSEIERREGLALFQPAYSARLRRRIDLSEGPPRRAWMTVVPSADFQPMDPRPDFFTGRLDDKTLEVPPDGVDPSGLPGGDDLTTAEVILDVGYGVRNADGMRLVAQLKEILEKSGLHVFLGATRKVTQDLKLLPLEHQIGQTGVRVNPKLIFAFGVSGAPQHMDYIGGRAVIFSFNKDSEAPLMKFNQTRSSPIVHPILGNLFETVPKLIAMLSA